MNLLPPQTSFIFPLNDLILDLLFISRSAVSILLIMDPCLQIHLDGALHHLTQRVFWGQKALPALSFYHFFYNYYSGIENIWLHFIIWIAYIHDILFLWVVQCPWFCYVHLFSLPSYVWLFLSLRLDWCYAIDNLNHDILLA